MAKAVFLQGALMRHVAVMSLTSSVGLMAIFAVDFVDMIFISMLGNKALAAAVGYAGTLLFFTNAINIGLSISAGSLVARSIGADQPVMAREYATSVAILGVLTGLVIPGVVFAYLDPILSWLGAEGETLALATQPDGSGSASSSGTLLTLTSGGASARPAASRSGCLMSAESPSTLDAARVGFQPMRSPVYSFS